MMTSNLYSYQNKIIQDDPKKCGLFLSTGTGKTALALLLARDSTLIIVPKTLLEQKYWLKEYNRMSLSFPLTVVSKEAFRKKWREYEKFTTVIADEAHQLLGAGPYLQWIHKRKYPKTSQVCRALFGYIQKNNPDRIYLLSATITRNPMVIWAAGIILGKKWGFSDFRSQFYFKLPSKRELWMPRKDSYTKELLGEKVREIGYTGKLDDYFIVPEQTYKTEYVELTNEQEHKIKEISLLCPDPLVAIGKQHQVENGILAGNDFREVEYIHNQKIERILFYADQYPKIIVFAKYIAQLDMIKSHLESSGKFVLTLTGKTKNREELLKKANESDACIFLCQASMGVGWELPSYPVAIFASMSWSLVDRIQAEGRILRANALKENMFITLIVKGGIDEEVKKAIDDKKDFLAHIYARKGFSDKIW